MSDLNIRGSAPTGEDQLRWLEYPFADKRDAAEKMAHSLIVNADQLTSVNDGRISHKWLKTIDDEFETFDPLVNFKANLTCPNCRQEDIYKIDLETLALNKLKRIQQALISSVHRLSSHYHWSERQIFSIPAWRRSKYLELIETEAIR